MNTHYAYKNVLTRHYSPRMIMRPRASLLRRRRQALIGAGISVFIITLGFVVTLNVADTKQIKAAVSSTIAATETNVTLNKELFSVSYDSPAYQAAEISLIAEDGNDLISTTQQAVKGMNLFEQKCSFATGVYYAKIKVQNDSQIVKVVLE